MKKIVLLELIKLIDLLRQKFEYRDSEDKIHNEEEEMKKNKDGKEENLMKVKMKLTIKKMIKMKTITNDDEEKYQENEDFLSFYFFILFSVSKIPGVLCFFMLVFNDSSHCIGTNIEPCPISKKGN